MPLLEIEDLHVEFPTQAGVLRAVEGVSLTLDEGDVLGIVGESGSGKSVTMLAVMGLVAFPGRVRAKKLRFGGHDVLSLSERQRRRIIGGEVAMIVLSSICMKKATAQPQTRKIGPSGASADSTSKRSKRRSTPVGVALMVNRAAAL